MRVQDWPERLAEYIQSAITKPFAWGSHDCATFAAGWVEVATGERIPLPECNSAVEYARLMESSEMRELVEQVLGDAMPNSRLAARGDVALVPIGDRLCLGIVVDGYVAGPGTDGLLYVPRSEIVSAWVV